MRWQTILWHENAEKRIWFKFFKQNNWVTNASMCHQNAALGRRGYCGNPQATIELVSDSQAKSHCFEITESHQTFKKSTYEKNPTQNYWKVLTIWYMITSTILVSSGQNLGFSPVCFLLNCSEFLRENKSSNNSLFSLKFYRKELNHKVEKTKATLFG